MVADVGTVVLLPLAAFDAVRRDDRLAFVGVAVDRDRRVGVAGGVLDVQVLVVEFGAVFQQHRIARTEVRGDVVDLGQGLPGRVFAGARVGVVAVCRRHVVGGA